MKIIRVSALWTAGIETISNTVIFNLIKQLSNAKILFVAPKDADLLFLGPYNLESIKNRIIRRLSRDINIKKISEYFEYFQRKTVFRKYQPITIFYAHENIRHDAIKSNFSINSDLGVNSDLHLRFPVWKENINWSEFGIIREDKTDINHRYGSYYDIEDMMRPQGKNFLSKKNFCIITSHMNQPRGLIYHAFKNEFIVDGYGPFFDKKIKNHNVSNFYKKDILKNYAFNLCPHNFIYPGLYEEKVPEAFLSKCLPVTWADENISYDFNVKSFVNLNNYIKNNFKDIIYLLKQNEFLNTFVDQPLLLSKPTLHKEIAFAKKIIDSL